MNTAKLVSLFVVALALGACAMHPKDVIQSWVGASEDELVAKLGAPDKVFETEGKKYLSYKYAATDIEYLTPFPHHFHGWSHRHHFRGHDPSRTIQNRCKTTFLITGGTVASGSYQGNYCVTIPPRPAEAK